MLFEIIKADFAAAAAALNARNHETLNLLANRLMANTVYGEETDRKYALPAFFLKEIMPKFRGLEEKSPIAEKMQLDAEKLVKELDRLFTEELDLASIWQSYHQFVDSTRKTEQSLVENEDYEEDPDFTARAITYLVQTVMTLEIVNEERGNVFLGIRNETGRLVRAHGIHIVDLITLCHLTALHRLYEYVSFVCSSPSGFDSKRVDTWMGPFLDDVKKFQTETHQKDASEPYSHGSEILCSLIYEWRLCFIKYFELARQPGGVQERRIELPEEAKQKIGETVAEALKKKSG